MITPKPTMSAAGTDALRDMVELQMYLVAQARESPWPLYPRSRTNPLQVRKPNSEFVKALVVWELMDLGFLEATSTTTFIVSRAGIQYCEEHSASGRVNSKQ